MADKIAAIPGGGGQQQGYTLQADGSYALNVKVVTAADTSDLKVGLPFIGGQLGYKLQGDGTYAMCVVAV